MSEPNKLIAAAERIFAFCQAQICNLKESIIKDWQEIKPVFERCWAKKTIDTEQWSDLVKEENLRWKISRLILKTFILVFVLGVIGLLPKRLVHTVTTAIPTKISTAAKAKPQPYAKDQSLRYVETDDGPKQIIQLEGNEQAPPGTHPYPDVRAILGVHAPMPKQEREVNNGERKRTSQIEGGDRDTKTWSSPLPYANLPITPGVPRSGILLRPLGGRH